MATPPPEPPRFAILGSGRGTNAAALMAAFSAREIPAELAVVISNVAGAPLIEKARTQGYPVELIENRGLARAEHEARLLERLAAHRVDHLLLAGYLRLLSPWFLSNFAGHILNIHPSLLPEFPGLGAVERQWQAGVASAGATVHLVDAGVDTGPPILSGAIDVRGDEGAEGLAQRILTEVEHVIYPRAVRLFCERLRSGLPLCGDATPPLASRESPMPTAPSAIRRALLSVSDKTGLADLGSGLAAAGVELLASGGTAATLLAAGVPVTAVEKFTGEPEILDGRVKTLHPRIYAGLLADRRQPTHLAALTQAGHVPIDLVVCNLYPFGRGLAEHRAPHELIELIDIGGPSLVRAAAKNAEGGVTVVVDPADYADVLEALRVGGPSVEERRRLAAKAFRAVADYDALIADWFERTSAQPAGTEAAFPSQLGPFVRTTALRYGENPHQRAYVYREAGARGGIALGRQRAGKELSYNNYLDLDMALRAVAGLPGAACAILKHTNPCGLACADSQPLAFERALAGDPLSAFGSVLGFNQPLTGETAAALLSSKTFVECIVAPGFTDEAEAALRDKPNLRLVAVSAGDPRPTLQLHRIGGGLLVQETDPGLYGSGDGDDRSAATWRQMTRRGLEPGWEEELRFALHAACLLKSNAIAVTKGRALVGVGTGHQSRIDAAMQALGKAGERASGAFLASDAFFPFPDCVEKAAQAGIAAIIQPGGSIRDADSIAACDRLGLAMFFTGRRHFRH